MHNITTSIMCNIIPFMSMQPTKYHLNGIDQHRGVVGEPKIA